jgi:hypothetical protein
MRNRLRQNDQARRLAIRCDVSRTSRRWGPRLVAMTALGVLLTVLVSCNPIAVPGDGQATVSWSVGDGLGYPIIGYQVTPYVGDVAQSVRTFDSTATTQTVTGLTNGTTYTFRITPITSCSGPCGIGTPSAPTLPVTVGAPTAPGVPSATAGNESAGVTWSAPAADNGSPITGYVITPMLGAAALPSQAFSSTATSETATGLTAGTTYTFGVAAINSRGTGPYSTSLPLVLGPPSAAITTGYYHSCMLLTTGTVECWGWNVGGQLGDGTTTDRSTPVAVQGLTGVTAITAGDYHSCALLTTGMVECWGANWSGQLGDGSGASSSTPVVVKHLSGVIAVTAGSTYSCALLADSTAKCWGENASGELGDGTTTNRRTPVVVKGLTGATALTGGQQHTCALLSTATEMCWGYNNWGQVGDGTTTNRSTPVAVQGLAGVTAITAGGYQSCALSPAGTETC